MEIGIDKLTLTTKEFRINRAGETGLTLKTGQYLLGEDRPEDPLLFIDRNGGEVRGVGAYLHDKLFTVDINSNGLRVIVNPSKPYHPYTLVNDTDTLATRMETVHKELKKRGIVTDLNGASINRVDIARNISTNEPVSYYGQVFSFLDMPRSKRQAQYPEGYSTGNNSRGVIAYNKLQECRDEGHDLPGNNLLRVEIQNKKTDAVKRFLKLNNYNDLLTCGVEHCSDMYRHTIKNEVFKIKPLYEQRAITFDNGIDTIRQLKKQHPHSWERVILVRERVVTTSCFSSVFPLLNVPIP